MGGKQMARCRRQRHSQRCRLGERERESNRHSAAAAAPAPPPERRSAITLAWAVRRQPSNP